MKRKICHYELFGLYTALKRIEGGRKRWRNSVRENPLINDEKIETVGTWIDKFEEYGGYKWEWRLESYVPANDPALLKFHRLTDIHFGRQGAARKISDHYHVPLKDAELSFKHLFREAKSEIGNGIYIFKCATGLGKSEELMHTNLDGCIVAVPTHKLKDELSQRMTTAKIKHIVIPELPSELPEGIQKKYDAYMAAGFFNYANGYLRSLKTEKLVELGVPLKEATSLSLELKKYFNKIKTAAEKDLPVLTTHKRVAHTDFPNHSTIIFDEDVIETIGEVKTVSLKDVRLSLKHIEEDSIMYELLSSLVIHSADPTSLRIPFTLNHLIDKNNSGTFTIDQSRADELVSIGIKSEVVSLLNAEVLVIVPEDHRDPDGEKNIHFIVRNEMPKDKKIIVLSATANEFIYRQLLGNLDFFDLSVVELQGTAIQYSNRGFSRASWFSESTQKLLKKISIYLGFTPTITYKSQQCQHQFINPFMHFENIVGTDELNGQNIAVVGTPNKPVFFYLLWAAFLRIEYDPEKAALAEHIVRRNGFEFNFMTFDNVDLQEVQFHFIEALLVQAVGRARLIRTNATVELFSKYPLIGFEQRNLRDLPDPNDGHLTHKVYSVGKTAAVYSLPASGSLAS